MNIQLVDIWIAAGVILGFQVDSFSRRINREVEVGKKDIVWLPPADVVNLIAITILVLGVFILPILGFVDLPFLRGTFGLAVLLFVGHAFALAGHYDLYSYMLRRLKGEKAPLTYRSYGYFPRQEKVVIVIITIVAVVYLIAAIIRS